MKKFKELIVSALSWIGGLGVFIPFGLIVLFLTLFINPKHFDPFIKAGCRLAIRMLGIRIQIEGLDRIHRDRTCVFMANHVNIFDGVILFGFIPKFVRGVELDEHFNWFFWGALLRRLGMIPISRTNARKAMQSLNTAKKAIADGTSILILPEGTRTRTGKFLPFKRGPFLLAKKAKVDIVPIVMIGAFKINQKGSYLIRPGKVILRIGEPFLYQDIENMKLDALKATVRNRMLELFEK